MRLLLRRGLDYPRMDFPRNGLVTEHVHAPCDKIALEMILRPYTLSTQVSIHQQPEVNFLPRFSPQLISLEY